MAISEKVKDYLERSSNVDVTHITNGVRTQVAGATHKTTVEVAGPDMYEQRTYPADNNIRGPISDTIVIVPFDGSESQEGDRPHTITMTTNAQRLNLPA